MVTQKQHTELVRSTKASIITYKAYFKETSLHPKYGLYSAHKYLQQLENKALVFTSTINSPVNSQLLEFSYVDD